MQTPPREFGFANLHPVNNGPTRCLPLFFVPPRRPNPGISAARAMSIAANFLQKQQKQRRCAEMAAETSDFDRLLQLPQVPPGRCPLIPRAVWLHLRGLQPEEEAHCRPAADAAGGSYRITLSCRVLESPPFPTQVGVGVSPGAPPAGNGVRQNR